MKKWRIDVFLSDVMQTTLFFFHEVNVSFLRMFKTVYTWSKKVVYTNQRYANIVHKKCLILK